MRIDIDRYTQAYYGICTALGIVAFLFNPWYGVAIWSLVFMGVFHEPVHWMIARHYNMPVDTMVNNKTGAHIDVAYFEAEKKKVGYIALGGFIFDLIVALFFCYCLTMAGVFVAGELWVAFVIVNAYRGEDLRTFWKFTVKTA